MSDTKPVEELVRDLGFEGGINSDNAHGFAVALGFDDNDAADLVAALEDIADWDGERAPDGEFEFRAGGWQLDLSRELVRAGLLAAVLAVFIASTGGVIGLPAIAIAVVPSLIEIKRVRLSEGHKDLLLEIRRLPLLTSKFQTPSDMYLSLPPEVQRTTNKIDYINFVAQLRALGLAEPENVTGTLRIRADGERSPVITWRD